MMKTLLILRHAKSDWGNFQLRDFDRELNERGFRDARLMGKKLHQRYIPIDTIISSTAQRAKQTAMLVQSEIGISDDKMQWSNELYHASAYVITEHVSVIDPAFNTVLIVCHNPGITHFVNNQCGFVTDNVPTCGLAAFEIDTDDWMQFSDAKKKLLFYDFPKNHS